MDNPQNPIGLDGIEFIEFAGPSVSQLEHFCARHGLVRVARRKGLPVQLWRQNDVNFLINDTQGTHPSEFQKLHGPSACAMGFRVRDAKKAFANAVERGARPFKGDARANGGWDLPAIYGIGDALVYFVDRYPGATAGGDIYGDFEFEGERSPKGNNLLFIDHMTNNVPAGEMQKWCDFYKNVFGFEERRYFDIKGKSTGLFSKVMKSPCGKFSIPINEPQDPKSQIQEYLNEYQGSGIQHIALLTEDIIDSVSQLKRQGVDFLAPPPNSYYAKVPVRVPKVKEPLKGLQELAILADGDEHGYLLQIFTKNQVGPIFVEIIQRRKHDGFGDGNFQALFDAMEEDQRARGVI